MSDNKKYYWLKLQKTFFNDKKVKKLRKIAGGEIYTIIYLKLLLESLENDCTILIDGICDDPMEELELSIDENKDNIKACLIILQKMDLCQFDNNIITFNDIERFIGSASTEAERVKNYRKRQKLLKKATEPTESTENNESTEPYENRTNVQNRTYERTEPYENRTPDREREKELNIDLDTDGEKESRRDEVDALLNHAQFSNFKDFEKLYVFWFTKLTGKPVTQLHQTVSAKQDSLRKLEWLKKNFKVRTVHAGVAIFDTLEAIAQDKSCISNYHFRGSNYLDGIISRLVDANLAKTDPVDNEGKGVYNNPTFDYFKYF